MPKPMRHKHPRLHGYDYSQEGAYFVTICTHEREPLFGHVVAGSATADAAMELNEAGTIVQHCWDVVPTHYPNVELNAFQVMPDHVHGIIVITGAASPQGMTNHVRRTAPGNVVNHPDGDPSRQAAMLRIPGKHGLANIVGSFKAAVTKGVNELRGTPGAPVWQKGYHDRIIRNAGEHDRIARYITENPVNWSKDTQHH